VGTGLTVQAAASPLATSRAALEVAERIRDAAARGESLRIVGGGSWLDAMHPVAAAADLRIGEHGGIVEYVPGDLTLSALAGTSLREIDRATAENGQWLTLDPPADPAATLGATIATASYGPLASAFGRPRDLVLGAEFVTGEGKVVRGGGRVVKNVAGFDLARLITGSWGTLGVITEVTVRLRARPREVSLAFPFDARTVEELGARLRRLPFTPMAAELLDEGASARLDLGAEPLLLLRLGGSDEALDAQRRGVGALLRSAAPKRGEQREIPTEVWTRLATTEPPGAATMRISAPVTRFHECWELAQSLAKSSSASHAFVRGTPALGVARVAIIGADEPAGAEVRRRLHELRSSDRSPKVIAERLPRDWWSSLPGGVVNLALHRRLKEAFDPRGILNPGLMGF
jgi:glycolate oxidase FAD binding subunit